MYRRLPMSRLALDRGYETGAVHRGLELLGITGYIPAIQFSNPPEKYGFSYDPQLDAFICPEGVPLTYHRLNCSKSTGKYLRCYQVEGDACMRCPKRPSCFDKAGIRRRVLASSFLCRPAWNAASPCAAAKTAGGTLPRQAASARSTVTDLRWMASPAAVRWAHSSSGR